jgi:hypothetical protein
MSGICSVCPDLIVAVLRKKSQKRNNRLENAENRCILKQNDYNKSQRFVTKGFFSWLQGSKY